MSGDYSRYDFDPTRDYQGVLLQQGRPLTDQDWNELVAENRRLAQATALDTFGGATVVPASTPDAFKLALSGGALTIQPGRIYVDGILAENHGTGTPVWNASLAEMVGSLPLTYDKQPYVPAPDPLPTAGIWLAYLDVYAREVNQYEAPDIVEEALGVDTTTRRQIVWQLKLLDATNSTNGSAPSCSTDITTLAGWNAVNASSSGRLSTFTEQYGSDNPCIIPPQGGYTGLENQFYRVEIHDGGAPGVATFKWSRDNASVEARVLGFVTATSFTVDSIGKDDVLGFKPGDWIELTDDVRELAGKPGFMLRIRTAGVDRATRTITVESNIDGSMSGVVTPDAARHMRIRRWDQKGAVLRTDQPPQPTVYKNLDTDTTSPGLIAVPTDSAAHVALENGITVSLATEATGGVFRTGDYWMFAARSTDASVESLVQAPPRGIHHHYAKLGYVDFGLGAFTDCRQSWPPGGGSESCSCTVCVSPQAHSQGNPSLQMAIDMVIRQGGGTVCLEAGDYVLSEPLRVVRAREGLTIRGQGIATRLNYTGPSALLVASSDSVVVEGMTVLAQGRRGRDAPTAGEGDPAFILYQNSAVTLLSLNFVEPETSDLGVPYPVTGVALFSSMGRVRIVDNNFMTDVGIASYSSPEQRPLPMTDSSGESFIRHAIRTGGPATFDAIIIDHNQFSCPTSGVLLTLSGSDANAVQLRSNSFNGGATALSLVGSDVGDGFRSTVDGNSFHGCTSAILLGTCGTGTTDICSNTLLHCGGERGQARGINVTGIGSVRVRQNCISDFGGNATVMSAAILVDDCNDVQVDHNALSEVGTTIGDTESAGVVVTLAQAIDVHGNVIHQRRLTRVDQSQLWRGVAINGATRERPPEGGLAWLGSVVNIQGNQITASTGMIAEVINVDTCQYTNNVSLSNSGKRGRTRAKLADVQIAGENAVASNNRVEGSSLSIALVLSGKKRTTVVGNITDGRITLNGGALPAPWAALNV